MAIPATIRESVTSIIRLVRPIRSILRHRIWYRLTMPSVARPLSLIRDAVQSNDVWIRGPWWDGFWILSGVPFGAALTGLSFWLPANVMILWIVLLTQTGHLLSPMALAWSHDGFRANMLRRPVKFVALPIAVLACSTVAGLVGSWTLPVLRFDPINFAIAAGPTTWVQFRNPFMSLVALYAAWNTYHFGKQAFGVMSIYRRKNDLLLSKSSGHYSSAFGHKDARDRTFG